MADKDNTAASPEPKAVEAGSKAAANGPGEHDRVGMLSLHPDGTPAQLAPEIIGNKDFALEATKRQLREQRVSAVDFAERSAAIAAAGGEVTEDPTIAALKAKHDAAGEQAEADAEKVVKDLTV